MKYLSKIEKYLVYINDDMYGVIERFKDYITYKIYNTQDMIFFTRHVEDYINELKKVMYLNEDKEKEIRSC